MFEVKRWLVLSLLFTFAAVILPEEADAQTCIDCCPVGMVRHYSSTMTGFGVVESTYCAYPAVMAATVYRPRRSVSYRKPRAAALLPPTVSVPVVTTRVSYLPASYEVYRPATYIEYRPAPITTTYYYPITIIE